MQQMIRVGLTSLVVAVAIALVAWKYWAYVTNPWTRDGQVRAQVIQIAPRVTGPIVELPIVDNQRVAAGDLLFKIDPSTFEVALTRAQAELEATVDQLYGLQEQLESKRQIVAQFEQQVEQARAAVESSRASEFQVRRNLERIRTLVERGDLAQTRLDEAEAAQRQALADVRGVEATVIQAQAALLEAQSDLEQATIALGPQDEANPRYRAALAARDQAKLDLDFTEVRAPVDGFVTNLNIRRGTQVVASQPVLALIDSSSFYVHGFFRETQVRRIAAGQPAVVTLMSFPDQPIRGRVHSLGWGIAQQDGSTGQDLLPHITPTFEWIRLAERVPVRIHLEDVSDDVALRVGTTASVIVLTEGDAIAVPPAPQALQ
ncbi:MAG: HlyD family secretion protein [Woeseiaceae bacterium]|jgi:multidrug resistance efflux pump|nr:HlyD family secretion protein [Woeseiaceae bacterium]